MGELLNGNPRHELTLNERKKGGSRATAKKKYKARLRELKKKGMQNETIKRLTDMMEDPGSNILDIKLFLDSLRVKKNLSNAEAIRLGTAYINLHKAHHGDKKKIEGELSGFIPPITVNIIPEEKKKEEEKDDDGTSD